MPHRETLSSRERIALALRHETTDRIPVGMVCAGINPPARKALAIFLAGQRGISVEKYLEPIVDIVEVGPRYIGPLLPPATDIWGVRRRIVSYGEGSYDEIAHYPLAASGGIPDLDAHCWPDPAWFDYEGLPAVIDEALGGADKCVMVGNGNIFETSWYMRGFEQMLMDVMTEEDLVHRIMDRVTRFYVEFFTRVLEGAGGRVDLIFTADDIGDQRGLLMPLEKWEKLLKPYHRRLNDAIHRFPAKVIYHTDGSVMPAVPGLIDNMDPAALKRSAAGKLCFEGGVSVQTTLPFGSPEEVEAEVRARIDVLGEGGGYILGPSHWIQAGTPPANIVAMFDTAKVYYPFKDR
jgi:uroporphyrinogen decarboxylase